MLKSCQTLCHTEGAVYTLGLGPPTRGFQVTHFAEQ